MTPAAVVYSTPPKDRVIRVRPDEEEIMEQPTLTACDGPWSNSCLGRRQFTALMALAALGGPLRSVGQSNDAGDDVEWLKDLQIPPAIQKTDLPKLTSLLEPREGTRITTVADWLPERRRLRDAWLEFLGPCPPNARKSNWRRFERIIRKGVSDGSCAMLVNRGSRSKATC